MPVLDAPGARFLEECFSLCGHEAGGEPLEASLLQGRCGGT